MDAELKAYLDALRRDVVQQIAATNQKMDRVNAETRQELTARMEQLNVEARRELRVLIEDVRHDVRLVADGVMTVRDELGRSSPTTKPPSPPSNSAIHPDRRQPGRR